LRIVVTGGSGRLGQFVIRDLLSHGHDVLSLDVVRAPSLPCPAWEADLRRIGDLYQALIGADAVIHLAAYQAPGLASDSETFSNNVTTTYNVLKVAADLGLARAVVASSVAAYGFLYAPRFWPPDYLPLDEQHPCQPQDPYGLSKLIGEQIAESFARRNGLSVASLRLVGIVFDVTYQTFPERWKNPQARLGGFWSYVDARDAASACRLAVETTWPGHEVLNIAAPTSSMPEPTAELIHRYLPEVHEVRPPAHPRWSGVDSSKAARLLGFRAEHTWERYIQAPPVK